MNVPMRTSYEQAIRLFDHCGAALAYALLVAAALLAPAVLGEYVLAQLSFVAIYAIAGVGMMLLMGYAGQISLGHAAFLAVGAYTEAILRARGLPFALTLPAAGRLPACSAWCSRGRPRGSRGSTWRSARSRSRSSSRRC